ncbi:MAG TPA: hypothetical protein VGN37_05655 [Actinocatenispora sp.]
MRVRQPREPSGTVVSPSFDPDDQVRPPWKDRSSHTSSPGFPLSMLAHIMSSACSTMVRDQTVAVTGVRSLAANAGSLPPQYVSHTVACGRTGAAAVAPVGTSRVAATALASASRRVPDAMKRLRTGRCRPRM